MGPIGRLRAINELFTACQRTNVIPSLPVHVRRISNVLPVLHSTATLKALDNPAIANFIAGKAERELKKLRDWEKLQVSEIQPFLDAKINIREIKALNRAEMSSPSLRWRT